MGLSFTSGFMTMFFCENVFVPVTYSPARWDAWGRVRGDWSNVRLFLLGGLHWFCKDGAKKLSPLAEGKHPMLPLQATASSVTPNWRQCPGQHLTPLTRGQGGRPWLLPVPHRAPVGILWTGHGKAKLSRSENRDLTGLRDLYPVADRNYHNGRSHWGSAILYYPTQYSHLVVPTLWYSVCL